MSQANSRTAAQITSLYEAHSADAFRYALHITGRREDAEDVVQYVFLQAYSALAAGRELVHPRAWLMKATKHRSLNLVRDRRDVPAAEVFAPGTPAADAGEGAALADVRASLWSLPETQHHAFVLRHWSGLSQDEIADVLATTPGAVESLLVRARATLVAEHEDGDAQCAGVRDRLVRMLVPTPDHESHLATCHRCRTAQARLLRASGFAAALVPGPQVAHALAAAIPGFGVSGAAAGTAAGAGAAGSGAGTGAGAGSAAVSTASIATKAGIAAKLAVVATTAAVAVTAVHPVRSAVSHALLGTPAPRAAASAPHQGAASAASGRPATGPGTSAAGSGGGQAKAAARGASGARGSGHGPAKGKGHGKGAPASGGGNGAGKGKSGTAGSNGNGNGQGGTAGGAKGYSASAPGRTKAPGSSAATGQGQSNGGSTNGSGSAAGSSNAGGNGGGGGGSNAGGGPKSNAGGKGQGTGNGTS